MADYPRPFIRYDGEDDDEDDEEDAIPKIRIGVCAMSKKTNSQPMQEILNRMSAFDCVDISVFPDDTILNVPVEEWPICDCLISFYSKGFPLEKAIEYAQLRKPFSLNDLEMQYALMDRPTMYSLLESAGIETPRHAILLRDDDGDPINTNFVETDDSVQIGDVVFQKPFVEKPVNAEDHNVYIYYPSSAGGGSQRLFRKVGNRSSVYSGESSVRKEGSYIYEDFVVTDGTDVKVYTVGPEYAHAEARKSPSLDGKVERDSQGKEIRYPVILNQYEKELANKVCNLFKQTVCGCDLLRTHGKSYVCDVNGFSFVKTSKKYYDDAAQVLMSLIVHKLAPQLYTPYNLDLPEETPTVEALEGTMLELRCVIGIIRHGDRTPKQKMKMEVRHPRFIELFKKYLGFDEHKLKLKRPTQLQEVLNIARDLLANIKEGIPIFERRNKLHQLKSVLEMYGYFSGINRKVQFKYLGKPREGSESESSESRLTDSGSDEKSGKQKVGKEAKMKDSKEGTGQSSEESQENEETKDEKLKVPVDSEHALLLIVKWGGELTTMGKEQALQLGRAFRSMYPGGQGRYSAMSGIGLLRLHSTYRHDLKIYASDEGRVQMTAAAFAKGFLALEGELTPVLVHLVRSDKNTTEMLDTSDAATKILGKVKHRLHEMLHSNDDFKEEDFARLAPNKSPSVINAMKFVKNPYKMCEKLHNLVANLTGQLKELISQKIYDPRDPFLYHDETLELMMHRWTKLEKDFKLKNGQFDISLIPDIYDCIKYDVQHNSNLCLKNAMDLYKCAKAFADIVIPQEYGITMEEKLAIAQRVCVRLLRKIRGDLRHADKSDIHTRLNPSYSQSVETPHRHVRTRLYFTSESHVHTVLNAFRFGKLFEDIPDNQWQRAVSFLGEVPELNYMTQIVLLLYEDPKADPLSENRFHVEMHFSPGAKTMDDPEFLARNSPTRKRSEEDVRISSAAGGSTTGNVYTTSRGVADDGHQVQDSVVNTTTSINSPNSSSAPYGIATSTYPGQSQTTEKTGSFVNDTANDIGSSVSAEQNSAVEEALESEEFEPYDETVYAGNERPRFAIGMEDYSDSAVGPSTGDSTVSSGTSIDDSSGEEKPLKRQRNSLSETEISPAPTEIERRCKSDSDVLSVGSPTRDSPLRRKTKDQEASSIKCIVEEDDSKPLVASRRPKAHSVDGSPDDFCFGKLTEGVRTDLHTVDEEDQENEYGSTDDDQQGKRSGQDDDDVILDEEGSVKPSSAKSDTSSVRPRKVSFDVVRDQGKSDSGGQPLKVVQSTPSLKKGGSPRKFILGTTTSSIRAVRNLSYAIQSALVVKPYSVTKSTKNSRKPPIADFYEEMTKVESLNPLRTLHNAIPLREMDSYFDKATGQNFEALVTPVGTPSRKASSKKLAAKSSNPTQLLAKMSSVASEVVEGAEELLNEKFEEPDS